VVAILAYSIKCS